jgi:hypothetical protein
MLLSLGGHSLALSFLIFVLPLLPGRPQTVRPHEVQIQPLYLKVPEQLLLARSAGSPEPAAPKVGPQRAAGARPAAARGRGRPGEPGRGVPKPASRAAGRPAPRLFELPEMPRRRPVPQVVLQPAFPLELDLAAHTRLPQLLLWAPLPKIAPPPVERFIAPGSPAPPKTPLVVDAPPRLEPPNVEAAVADLKLAASVLFTSPRLPRPPASVAPIRQFVAPEARRPEPQMVSDPFPGEPTNLLALSSMPAPLKESLVLQPGHLFGEIPPAPPASGEAVGSEAGAGAAGETAAGVGASGVPTGGSAPGEGGPGRGGAGGAGGSASGSPAPGAGLGGEGSGQGVTEEGAGAASTPGGGAGPPGTGTGAASAGAGAGGTIGVGSGGGAASGGGAGLGSAGPASGLPSSVPTRIEHPVTAVFDVVVEGAAPLAGQGAGAGVLSGKPVYTVYLPAGPGKQWMLQYCVPKQSGGPRISGGVVSLGAEPPLRAPFPRTMIIPPAELLPDAGTVLVHGYIDAKGQFQELRAVSAAQTSLVAALLPHLQSWVFRPAVRGGAPVAVEVLLVIPATAR